LRTGAAVKIAIIAPFPKYKRGIPRVTEELISKLSEADNVESVTIIVAKTEKDNVSPSLLKGGKVSLLVVHSFLLPWTFFRAIKLCKESDALLVFTPRHAFWLWSHLFFFQLLMKLGFLPEVKWVQMLYDFVFDVCPEDVGISKETMLFKIWSDYFVYVPVRYVAISESTKREAMRYWNLTAAQVTVVHLSSFIAPKTSRAHFGSRKILTVSDISPRKNQLRLIEAFELVYQNCLCSGAELMIVGLLRREIPGFESTLRDIQRRNSGIKITLAGYVPDSEILSLYEEADIFVYPSLYEGFGLPVLEAMACGCPVIVSNISSLREVVGEAGMLVDPYDVEALAHAMSAVLQDDELKREMSRKGTEQARKFSWKKAGAELVAVCSEVAERTD
jgi:glycosyltransferase involved in cell wall biosynthesis